MNEHHAREVRERGYTIVPEVLTPAEVSDIKAALAPWLGGLHMGRNDFEGFRTERVYALLAKDDRFARIVEHPRILPIVDLLLEANYLLSANLAINVHPGETPQSFHTDNSGMPYTSRTGIHGISTIWAFDDFTETNGATEVIPGSHLWEDERPLADDSRAEKVIMPAGSVVVFSGSLFHRGGANRSDRVRLAITPQYCQSWLRQLENMTLAVPPDIAARFSPRVQAMLGYSVREPGFMGYVDGMHPMRLVDEGYRGRKARGLPS
ncbi:MAG: phytanoyl-CoA dioxygenase family protein [Pseudomonadales bacterium]|nr:phytanoyl-CoA dioxygenase family protein [Pseudomonadales bacterium]